MRVTDVLKGKAIRSVVTISPGAPVGELVTLLARHNVGALVVSADGSTLDGIVSERDVVRRLNEDATLLSRQVHEIMTTDVHTCSPDDTLTELMQLMTDQRVRHLPVLEDDKVVGVVSIGDVVKNRISELEFEREQLENYVHST